LPKKACRGAKIGKSGSGSPGEQFPHSRRGWDLESGFLVGG
jgi:hypothetical protein